ncbi:MAG: hypothetical protein IT382_14915 [Deltaproteobacteria bacterium]|nr:hypothetical protein [Deltaproteobacteria bacterium]
MPSKDQKIPTGIWSSMMYEAIKMSEMLMMQVVDDMRMSWAVKSEELTLEHLNREKFLDRLMSVDGDPEASRALNERLSRLLIPIIEQAMAPPPQPGQPAPEQGA